MDLGFNRQGWITALAALLLALITLFAGYDHVDLLGAASVDLFLASAEIVVAPDDLHLAQLALSALRSGSGLFCTAVVQG